MIFILFQMHKGGGEEKINYSRPWKSTETENGHHEPQR